MTHFVILGKAVHRSSAHWCLAFAICISAIGLIGCGSVEMPEAIDRTEETTEGIDTNETGGSTAASRERSGEVAALNHTGKRLSQKLKFKVGDGQPAFSIKPEPDGGKLVDANEKELARFKLQDGKLKIKLANETTVAYIVPSSGKLKIKNPEQAATLWTLRSQEDGDWKLEDGKDNLVYKIKLREYGYELENGSDKSLAKAKRKGDKTSLRDPNEKTLFYTKDPIKPESLICLGFESIQELSVRAGLLLMVEIGAADSK